MTVTVSGGGNTVLVFNVSGSAASNYASDFSGALGAAPTVSNLGSSPESTVPGAFNYLQGSTTLSSLTLTTANQFTYIDVATPFTVFGSSGGDTVAGGTDLTYKESAGGSFDKVIFTSGTNTFDGSSVAGGGDTIAGGSGSDTINTGAGQTTVFSGANSTITLNDISAKGGDLAVLQQGNSIVNAVGAADTVFATTGVPDPDGSTTGTIFGGAGVLTFVTSGNTSALPITIVGGSGTTNVYGAANLDLTLAGGGTESYVAGAGNETLNGFNSAGFAFFGDTSSSDAPVDSVTGGTGFDYFSTGAGHETFTAGSGADSFYINSISGGASITIHDFSSADSVSFQASITGTSTAGGNLTVTLNDGTTVEFTGITSLPSHS